MNAASTRELAIAGRGFRLAGSRFHFQGLSFFNALFNQAFNRTDADRRSWLEKFRDNGISVLRVWCQWDFASDTFIDTCPRHSLFTPTGGVDAAGFDRLAGLLTAADALGMVIEVTLFCMERNPNLPPPVQEAAVDGMARRLVPYRNLILQIWNECPLEVPRFHALIKAADPRRIVCNAPGYANDLGTDEHNRLLDVLTPHTVRGESGRFWEDAPRQLEGLQRSFAKPIVDDEPARSGPTRYGGIAGGTQPWQHIEQIRAVRSLGCHHIYHHDMFQYRQDPRLTPPSGIPDPDFSPFHREVFDFLRAHPTW